MSHTNPRRIPRTEAAETMQKFNQKFNQTVSAIINGEVKYQDIVNALKEEYGLEMEFR